ncbi:HIRA-interacting protein 3 isoform 2-T2 [Lycodopsis pacificus]
MMASEKEEKAIRRFVCGQLRDEPNLSTLTLRILKRRYLAHVRCESLGPEARNIMRQVVEEELMKMQDNDENGSELETSKKPQNKRKRGKEKDEVISGEEDDEEESTTKKSRRQSNSSSDDCKTGSESEEEERHKSESEDAEQEVKKSQRKTNANSKQQMSSEDSTDEEMNKSEEENDKNESNCEDEPKEVVMKRANATKNGEKRSSNTSKGKKTPQSDEEKDTDSKSEKSDKINGNDSSDDGEKEEKVSVEHKNSDLDSDSSSLPSLEDEQHSGKKQTDDKKKKAPKKKEKSARSQKDDDKAVVRLKRYISLCGVRLNYKKLLDGCRSVRSQVAVLKKELDGLGVHGQPSIVKCKKVRMKREESQELAELDVGNIIATKGRPKRRGASAWQEQRSPPSSTYLRSLNSGSDSDEENNTPRGQRRATDWANLHGIISDDAESN